MKLAGPILMQARPLPSKQTMGHSAYHWLLLVLRKRPLASVRNLELFTLVFPFPSCEQTARILGAFYLHQSWCSMQRLFHCHQLKIRNIHIQDILRNIYIYICPRAAHYEPPKFWSKTSRRLLGVECMWETTWSCKIKLFDALATCFFRFKLSPQSRVRSGPWPETETADFRIMIAVVASVACLSLSSSSFRFCWNDALSALAYSRSSSSSCQLSGWCMWIHDKFCEQCTLCVL